MRSRDDKIAALVRYSDTDDTPVVTGAAQGRLAQVLEDLAVSYKLPVIRDRILAASLVGKGIGPIPEKLFPAVAEILAYCYKTDARFKDKLDRRTGKAYQ